MFLLGFIVGGFSGLLLGLHESIGMATLVMLSELEMENKNLKTEIEYLKEELNKIK